MDLRGRAGPEVGRDTTHRQRQPLANQRLQEVRMVGSCPSLPLSCVGHGRPPSSTYVTRARAEGSLGCEEPNPVAMTTLPRLSETFCPFLSRKRDASALVPMDCLRRPHSPPASDLKVGGLERTSNSAFPGSPLCRPYTLAGTVVLTSPWSRLGPESPRYALHTD